MLFWRHDFCLKCDFENVIFAILKMWISWNMRFWTHEFLIKCDFLPQCVLMYMESSCRGQKLVNPIKYHMCLICGPKHLDYTKKKLLEHYNNSHMANFSLETMPKSLRKCSICGQAFLTEELLLRHKSFHVDPRYFKNRTCPEAFRTIEWAFLEQKIG